MAVYFEGSDFLHDERRPTSCGKTIFGVASDFPLNFAVQKYRGFVLANIPVRWHAIDDVTHILQANRVRCFAATNEATNFSSAP